MYWIKSLFIGVCYETFMWYNQMIEIIITEQTRCQSNPPCHPLPSSSACNSSVLFFTRSRQATIVLRGAPCLHTPRIQQRFSSACCFTVWGSAWRGSGPRSGDRCTLPSYSSRACDITSWCHQGEEQSVPRWWRLSLSLINFLSASS